MSADIYRLIGESFPASTQKRMLARKKTVEQLVRCPYEPFGKMRVGYKDI